jgi:hypothetical protein
MEQDLAGRLEIRWQEDVLERLHAARKRSNEAKDGGSGG